MQKPDKIVSLNQWEIEQIRGLARGMIIDLKAEIEDLSEYGVENLDRFRKLLKKVSE